MNTLAYYGMATITEVRSFMEQAQVLNFFKAYQTNISAIIFVILIFCHL
jgi:hypothetical protein